MANPPTPVDPPDLTAPVTHGTILSYGLEDLTVTGILIDSYKRDASFANGTKSRTRWASSQVCVCRTIV